MHRRSVWQVLGIFLAASWGVLQVVEFLTEAAGLPDWTPAMALVLLLLGLPVCLATAFVQEGMPGQEETDEEETPDPSAGVMSSAPAAGAASTAPVVGTASSASAEMRSSSGSGATRLFTWRNAIFGGLGAFTLLGMTLMAYFVMWSAGIGPVGNLVAQGVIEEREPVILAQFENRTDEASLGAVVTDALRVDLLESQVVTLLDGRLIDDVLRRMSRPTDEPLTPAVAREVAVREGIRAVIEGDVSRVGEGYVLAVEIVSPRDGSTLAAFRETAESDAALLAGIDRLSQRLREKAGESLRDIRAGEPLERVTTSSLDALRLYAEAREAEEDGELARAIDLLEGAIALDTAFAMAWRKLAVQHANRGGDFAAELRAATAAYRHRDRLTERERLLAEAYYHTTVTERSEEAARAYRQVLELHPDDPTALNNLGTYYMAREEWERATELYVRAIEGPGRSPSAYNNLIISLYDLGRKEAALATVDDWEDLYDFGPNMVRQRFTTLWGMGELERAEAAMLEGIRSVDDPLAEIQLRDRLASFMRSLGRLDDARALYRRNRSVAEAADLPVQAFFADAGLAWTELTAGADSVETVRTAERRFEESLDGVPPLNRPHGLMGILWAAGAGDPGRARAWWTRGNDAAPAAFRDSPAFQEDLLFQEGAAALLTGDHERGLDAFRDLRRRQECAHCYERWLARAFLLAGQPDSAVVYLEAFVSYDEFDFVDGRETQLEAVLPELARLYEEVGRPDAAAAALSRFADRWTAADAVLQGRVRHAREQADRLTSGGP